MTVRFAAALLAGAVVCAFALPSLAADAPKTGYRAPLASDGHPDLTGVWTNATLTKLERDPKYGTAKVMPKTDAAEQEKKTRDYTAFRNKPSDLTGKIEDIPCSPGFVGTNCGYNAGWIDPGDSIMTVAGQPRTSFITYPDNGRVPPFKAGARPSAPIRQRGGEGEDAGPPTPADRPAPGASADQVRAAGAARTAARGAFGAGPANPENLSLGERCIMSFGQSSGPVMQPQLYNNNYTFVQTKDTFAIEVEMVHDVRVVHLNQPHRTDGIRPWMGDSVGHWEGNTLVIETTNFPKAQAFRGSWENLKVTERLTRVAPDRILYQFEVSDPSLWDKPWGGEYEFGKGKAVYEYACHEGNYAMEGILAGARDEERKAAEAASKPRADATR